MLIVVEKKDKRDEYLIKILQKDGYNVMLFGAPCEKSTQKVYVMSITSLISEDTAEALDNNSVIFARDASDGVKAIFDKKNIVYHNYNDDEEFIVNNAYITAEGALAYIIQNTYMSLSDINALVLGYGRVGKEMCKALKSNNAYTAIVTSKAKSELSNEPIDKSYTLNELTEVIKHFDVIINTVPSIILKGEILDLIDKECFIIDLASKPGGLDFDAASSLGLKVMHALGIPGKVAPATAARYLKESIIKSLI